MATVELRRHRVASATAVNSIGTTVEIVNDFLHVPRNTRAHLVSLSGSLSDAESPTSVTNRLVFGLARSGPAVINSWINLVMLWATTLTRSVTGTPANSAFQPQTKDFDKDLQGQADSIILSKGAQSNQLHGWAFSAQSAVASYDIIYDITLNYVLEWIGGGGSKSPLGIIGMDEEEMTDDDGGAF